MRLLLTLLSDCEFPAALVGSGARWSTSGIYHLEVYMAFSPGIHSFWQYLACFHVLWHSIWHSIWRLYWHTFCMVFILAFFQAFYLGSILTFYLSGIFSGVHSGRILTFFLAYVSGISSDILSGNSEELAVEVRRGTLWSWNCGGGPAENTAIQPALPVEVRRGSLLWSCACCSGLAANTAI